MHAYIFRATCSYRDAMGNGRRNCFFRCIYYWPSPFDHVPLRPVGNFFPPLSIYYWGWTVHLIASPIAAVVFSFRLSMTYLYLADFIPPPEYRISCSGVGLLMEPLLKRQLDSN